MSLGKAPLIEVHLVTVLLLEDHDRPCHQNNPGTGLTKRPHNLGFFLAVDEQQVLAQWRIIERIDDAACMSEHTAILVGQVLTQGHGRIEQAAGGLVATVNPYRAGGADT